MRRKQQREIATCVDCGSAFTRIRQFARVVNLEFAEDTCMRCRAKLDINMRERALMAAKRRWNKAIEANDRALARCKSGKLRFVDARGDKTDE